MLQARCGKPSSKYTSPLSNVPDMRQPLCWRVVVGAAFPLNHDLYYCPRMKQTSRFLVVSVLVSTAFAALGSYVDGSIVIVQKKVNTRVLYYIVNTPVTRDDPYYEVQMRVKDTVYT